MVVSRSIARLPALLVTAVVLAACTGGSTESTDEDSSPRAGEQVEAAVSGEEPLVLVTRADRPQVRLSRRAAEQLLAGAESRWSLVHAGLPTVAAAELAGREAQSPGMVLRRVRRRDATIGALPASAVDATVRPVLVDGIHPLRRPDSYPLRVPGNPPAAVTTLTVVGDVMLTRRVPDAGRALRPMARRLARADLTVGTLESTLSDQGRPQQGGDSFAASPDVVGLLEEAGFDALSLANNHVGDYQTAALLKTVELLRRSAIKPFGAGRDLRAAGRAAVIEQRGVRFAFLGFNAIGETPRATPERAGALSVRMPPRTGPFVEADLRHVESRIRRLEQRADVVVVLPHWGTQYTHVAEPIQRRVARRLSSAGADLVVGGHPHWVQGIDHVDGTLVAHSLGNFVFDMDFMTQTQQGVVLETTWWGDELKGFELVPYRMDADFAPRMARGEEAEQILGDVWAHSHGPFSVGSAN